MCNVLSDIYSLGITEIDHFLAILGVSTELNEQQRTEVASQILMGMEEKAREANTKLTGG